MVATGTFGVGEGMKIELRKFFKGPFVLFSILVLLFVFAALVYDQFLTVVNITNVLRQVSMIGLVSVGMNFVILTGGIDLSVGSMMALAGLLTALLSRWPPFIAILLPFLMGCAFGLLNGLVITRMKIIPIIATLATQLGIRGIAYIISDVRSIPLDREAAVLRFIGRGYIFGIPFPALIFIFFVFVAIIISGHTTFGRGVYGVGGNETAAGFMGLKVKSIKTICYAISGGLSALAGIVLACRLSAGQAVAGMGWEMTAVAAVAIGGTYFSGGVGKISGTFIGVILLGLLTNIINLQGDINSWWQQIVTGILLLFVVIIQSRTKLT
jgi:ribose transport system permease protein